MNKILYALLLLFVFKLIGFMIGGHNDDSYDDSDDEFLFDDIFDD